MSGAKPVKKRFQIVAILRRFWYNVSFKRLEVFQKVSIGNVGQRVAVMQKSKSFRVDILCWLVALSILKFEIQT